MCDLTAVASRNRSVISARSAQWIVGYLGAALAFGGLDAVWLTLTSATIYRPVLAPVMAASVRPLPALLFYVVYLAGLTVFAVVPAVRAARWTRAPIAGGLFGFFAYATYDLTNQATLAVWATKITVLDLAWGTFASAVGATAGYFAARTLAPEHASP